MKIKTKEVRNVVAVLDDIVKEYKEERPEKKRDWRTYEQRVAERLRTAFKQLKPLVHEAASSIRFVSGETRGAKPVLNVEQRVLALLIKHIIGKSNRNMSAMFVVFSLLSGIDVSYKTVERFYSDPEVIAVLHNLHVLILKKKGVKEADCSGDGTGYSLTIKEHYATEAQKLKEQIKDADTQTKKEQKKTVFIYSFTLTDLKTRMHVSYGTSFKSEKKAYASAIEMAEEIGIDVRSIRLDRYFSNQSDAQLLTDAFGKLDLYLIPKSNATIKGSWAWKRMLARFVGNTKQYLEEYYKRNQSESCIAEDKKRTGWKLGQKRPDRVDTANMLTSLWHNLYWLG
ncbi:MAG: ISNCY family transposase [Nanoarchaeota archaeon]|nr:ISNCY family transposase [Nanoarchaeota archaeon]